MQGLACQIVAYAYYVSAFGRMSAPAVMGAKRGGHPSGQCVATHSSGSLSTGVTPVTWPTS